MPRFALVLAAFALTFASGCGSKSKQKRAGDAAPVEVVQQPIGDAGAGGASADEVEPNDGEDVATPLPLGTTLRGKIDPDSDADYYRIDVKVAGALAVELSGVDGMDLTLEIFDGTGTSLARSDRGGVHVREGVPNLGVLPGRYTAVVRAKKLPAVPAKKAPAPKKSKKGPAIAAEPPEITIAPTYELVAQVSTPAANAELEPDDDRGTAIDLIAGDTVTGYIGWTGDADVWKLSVETLSEKNPIDVEISAVEGVALTLELVDGIGRPLLVRKAPRGVALVARGLVPVVPPGAPPFHYLTIRGDRSNPETAYQLRVSAKPPVTDGELEPNDTPERAMPVPPDRTVVHATWTPGDLDNFALPVEQNGRTVEITIDPPGDADLSAELLVAGKPVGKGERPGKGAQEKFSGVVPAGATAILHVHGSDSSLEGAYDVSIQDGPAAP